MSKMTLQIEEGKYYRTRKGKKVGPAKPHDTLGYPWVLGKYTYTDDGQRFIGEDHPTDLVAEWEEPDIFNIEKPFGMLDEATQEALLTYDGEIEIYNHNGLWQVTRIPGWIESTTYRAVPKPKRETVTAHLVLGPNQCQTVALDIIDGEPDLNSIRPLGDV